MGATTILTWIKHEILAILLYFMSVVTVEEFKKVNTTLLKNFYNNFINILNYCHIFKYNKTPCISLQCSDQPMTAAVIPRLIQLPYCT